MTIHPPEIFMTNLSGIAGGCFITQLPGNGRDKINFYNKLEESTIILFTIQQLPFGVTVFSFIKYLPFHYNPGQRGMCLD